MYAKSQNPTPETGSLDTRQRSPPDFDKDAEFDIQAHPWQETKNASLRSDAIAVPIVIAMSWTL
jgi:hypothetical protein